MAAKNQGKEDGSPFAPLRRMISAERFSTYMTAAGHDEERALLLYLWNAQLGEAFHLPIQAVEVGLRNCVDQALQLEFGTTWWGEGDFRTLVDRQQIEAIDVALRGIARREVSPTHGGVVSGLSFGFWVAMLKPRYTPVSGAGGCETRSRTCRARKTEGVWSSVSRLSASSAIGSRIMSRPSGGTHPMTMPNS